MKKRINYLGRRILFLCMGLLLCLGTVNFARAATQESERISDTNTMTTWEKVAQDSTQYVGRIWTDKSVFTNGVTLPGSGEAEHGEDIVIEQGESDFLIGLSALSSTSNLTTQSAKPLDIVLVLDTSGSMDDGMDGESSTYKAIYAGELDQSRSYYIDYGWSRIKISYDEDKQEWGYYSGRKWNPVTPKANANGSGTQVYFRDNRLWAMQTAVNNFINATAKANETMAEGNQHRISIVTYASNADTKEPLQDVTADTAQSLKNTVNNLAADGATNAGEGMTNANKELQSNNARANAQEVVIFFTDGTPTTSSLFNERVANTAVKQAGEIKSENRGGMVYSIGIFDDANSEDPTNRSTKSNQFMHAVSSNYPKATAYNNRGDRAEGDFYKTATETTELNKVFDEIFDEIKNPGNVPTKVEGNDPMNSGYITIEDELGAYMAVDGFNQIVFADRVFQNPTKTIKGNIDTYTFNGSADASQLYPNANLNEIVITVERSEELAKGDKVKVQIPAALIPLRHFDVQETDAGSGAFTTSVSNTYPMRIFFGVSLKDDAVKLLENPNEAMKFYIAENTGEDGKVNFYSNTFTKNAEAGKTTAIFTPDKTNKFYYFGEDVLLYTTEDCTEVATRGNSGSTIANKDYWYQRTYYSEGNTQPQKEIVKISNNVVGQELLSYTKLDDQGRWYVPAETPRLMTINNLYLEKAEKDNQTNTALDVIDPQWVRDGNNHVTDEIVTYLGNNGKLAMDVPGSLEISKTVTAEEGLTAPNKEFTFKVDLEVATDKTLKESYSAQRFDVNGKESGEAFTIEDQGTVTLKAGEKVRIYGIDKGTAYNISEESLPAGFVQTVPTDNKPVTGTIGTDANTEGVNQASFTNEYAVENYTISSSEFGLAGTKTIEGRDFEEGDIFRFEISASQQAPDSPLPTNSKNTIEPTSGTQEDIGFGSFTFDKPGQYRYSIKEYLPNGENVTEDPADRIIPGMTYDTTEYRLVIDVADNHDGHLMLTSVGIDKRTDQIGGEWEILYASQSENGQPATLPGNDEKYMNFKNTWSAESQSISLTGEKVLSGKVLGDYTTREQFGFALEAGGSRIDENADFITDNKQPMPTLPDPDEERWIYRNSATGDITISGLTFTADDIGKEYKYIIRELQPTNTGKVDGEGIEGATKNNDGKWVWKGITFDDSSKEITIKVTDTADGIKAKVQTEIFGNNFEFINSYDASTTFKLDGSKQITGRNFKNGDAFTFNIVGNNGAPSPKNSSGQEVSRVTINPESGTTAGIDFGTITFTQADMKGAIAEKNDDGSTKQYTKEFTYTLIETGTDGNGMKYDTAPRTVTVVVTDDNHGKMNAEVKAGSDALSWSNTYTATGSFTDEDLTVTKVLKGRSMKPGEFHFTIKNQAGTPELSKEFTNEFSIDSSVQTLKDGFSLSFTQNDVDKDFNYVVDEQESDAVKGVTYDKSQYKVTITPRDNGDGTIRSDVKVTKTVNKDGTEIDENVNLQEGKVVIPFENTYSAAEGVADLSTGFTKMISGRGWKEGDSFTFNITGTSQGGGIAPMPKNNDGTEVTSVIVDYETAKAANATAEKAKVDFGFGLITFDSVGEYEYQVTEENAGDVIDGMAYEKNSITFTISVTDDGTGQFKAECKLPTNTTFNNVYSATLSHDQAGMLITTKKLSGRDMNANEFRFKVEALESDTVTAEEAAKRIYLTDGKTDGVFTNPRDAKDGEVSDMSSDITRPMVFTQADVGKVFTYEFSEIEPSEDQKLGGVTYDKTVYKVELSVTDDGDGTLTLHTKVNGSETTSSEADPKPVYLDFVNRYAPKETTLSGAANLVGTKTLTGRALAAEEFSFKLEADPEHQTTVDAVADGSVVLPQATEVKNDANGAFSFGDITFKKAGDYQFKISEVPGTLGGITYDDTSYIVKVKVTDNGDGTMTATIDGEKPSLAFNNRYGSELPQEEVTKTNVSFTKQLTGRSWTANDTFTFEMTALTENAPMPANAQVTVNSPEGKDKVNFSFGEIAFTYDMVKDEPNKTKTFEYEVKEVIPQEGKPSNGMTYDTHTAKVKITVTDNGDGTMSATTEATGTDFVNTYRSEVNYAQFNTGLAIIKTLTGHDMAKDQFTFVITPGDQASADKLGFNTGANEVKSPAADDGAFAMIDLLAEQQILFTQEDVSKTYTYEIKEEQGTQGGYTYDPTVYTVTITSSDNGAGVLTVTTRVEAEGKDTAEYIYSSNETPMSKASVAFKNSYAASGQLGGDGKASIEATKVLNGRPMEAGEFNFVVKDAKDQIVTEGTHAAAGIGETAKITFDPIEYTTESLKAAVDNGTAVKSEKDGKDVYTFQYTVSEEAPTQGGVSGTKDRFTILVTVTDHNNGTLEPAVSYPQGTDHLAFENTYSTGDPITYQPNGQKKVEAATGLTPKDITGQFTFTLTADEGTPMPETTSVTNDAQGNIAFGEMEFTQDLLTDVAPDDTGSRSKTFTYRVEETGTVPGVTNDPGAKTFSLTLTDDGKGHLTLTSDPEEGTLFTFVNTYSVTPVESRVTDQIVVEKSLVGRELEANEFSFELLDEADQVVATGTNDVDGKVALTPITYDQPGTHTYKLHEVKGEAGFGVQYDERVHTITTTVSDQGDGTLKVEHQIEGDQIAFENVYEPAVTSVQLTAAKVLQGRDLKDGEFTFQIKDDKDQVVAEAHNDAEGRILFDAIELKEAGERTYTISEVGGNDKTIAYDVTSYKVKVIVTDDLKGHLVAEVQADEAPIFTNSVIPQEKPQDPPKPSGNIMTGIQNHLGMITAGFLCMVIAILATTALIVRRRNH